MVNIGICDDEASMRRALRAPLERKLQLLGTSYRILEYDSGEALFSHPECAYLDILFLDIEMRQMNGMETAKNLRKRNAHTLLIFVTAYPDFVFQGYEVHAFHYILKPYEERKHREQYFTLEQKSGILRIPLKRILAFSSDRRKVVISLKDGSRPDFYGKLDEVESGLPDYFVRCHNRHLVNLNFVSALEKDRCICGQKQFPVSRAFRQPLEIAFARLLLR